MPGAADGDRTPRWGLGDVAVGLVPFAVVAVGLLTTGGGDGTEADPTVGSLVASSLLLWVFLVGVPLFATRIKGAGPVADLGLRLAPADAGWFAAGAALQAVGVRLLYWPLFRLTDLTDDDVAESARELVDSATGLGMLVLVLVVCVGAPVAEELFFRGLLLRAAARRFGTGAALVGSTLLFAASHFQGVQLPALVLFGAVAGVLAVRTGRLGAAMACHAGFNAWTVFELAVLQA